MNKENPIGIKFIGWFQIVSALVILLTLNIPQDPPFNIRFAIPFIPEFIAKILISIIAIIIGYGYLKQLKWGYYSMLIYSILFCCISLVQMYRYNTQPFIGNFIYATIVIIYTVINSKSFIKSNKIKNHIKD